MRAIDYFSTHMTHLLPSFSSLGVQNSPKKKKGRKTAKKRFGGDVEPQGWEQIPATPPQDV
jgi:hypothetical protein